MDLPIETTDEVAGDDKTRNRLLAGVLLLLGLYACASAAAIVVPLLAALLLGLMLSPLVRLLCEWRVPRAIAVALVMASALLALGSLFYSLIAPAGDWIDRLPIAVSRLEASLSHLRAPLRDAGEAGEQIAKLTDFDPDSRLQRVVSAGPSQLSQLIHATPGAIGSVAATLFMVFIFLLRGDTLLRKLVELAPALNLKKDIVLATRNAQRELAAYVGTIAAINSMLGLLLALALWWLGVADPLLWGALAALLNFVPFVGPALMILLLTLVGFGHSEQLLGALAVPSIFIVLNAIEEFLTPLIVGHRLNLEPSIVFPTLMLCGWLWGPAGLLLATPLLTCLHIVAQRKPAWNPVARLLGP